MSGIKFLSSSLLAAGVAWLLGSTCGAADASGTPAASGTLQTGTAEMIRPYLKNPPIEPLRVQGEDFVNAKGQAVRFWGVNVVALFPQKTAAEGLAARIASFGFNLVRPHHYMRQSLDWNTGSKIEALADYDENSYSLKPEAVDRFDYLNAQLRKHGIYLAFALRYSRNYVLKDSKIIATTPEDDLAWRKAMSELNTWDWRRAIDARKMLPTFDERCQAIDLEFAKRLLSHVNPYTGLSYANDPQVLTIETINEFTSEYTIICGAKDRFPKYFEDKLQAKWLAFVKEQGGEPCLFWELKTQAQKELRQKFLVKLDEDYFRKVSELVRSLGSKAALTYSNLWRGEAAAELESRLVDSVEDHTYTNPFFAEKPEDAFLTLGQKALAGKPFFVGELNQAEGGDNIRKQSPFRSQLPLAMAAYGSFSNYTGLVWFAWQHGDRALGDDGQPAKGEGRESNIGELMTDGMQLDHMRAAGLIFRRGLAAKSAAPIIVRVDPPFAAHDYNALMRPKYPVRAGWQDVHALRKAFAARADTDAQAAWFTQDAPKVLASDTGEIVKDTVRRQLTLHAAQAEGFSGSLDANDPAGLRHLRLSGKEGFATVLLVAADALPLEQSRHLLISRTTLDKTGREMDGDAVLLEGLAAGNWTIRPTRPESLQRLLNEFTGAQAVLLRRDAQGRVLLPAAGWKECELVRD